MRWAEITAREPALGAAAHERLIKPGVVLIGTTRHDVTYVGFTPDRGDQHVARWPGGEEYVRPAISPTRLGARQPVRRVLRPADRPG